MLELLKALDAFVWGTPLLILLVGTGIYLTIRLGLFAGGSSPKGLSVDLYQGQGTWRCVELCCSLYGSSSHRWYGKYHRGRNSH